MITIPRCLPLLAAAGVLSINATAASITAAESAHAYFGTLYPDSPYLYADDGGKALFSFVLPELTAGQSYGSVTFSIGVTRIDYSLPVSLYLLSQTYADPTIRTEHVTAPSQVVEMDFITSAGVTTSIDLASHVNNLVGNAGNVIVFSLGGDGRSYTFAEFASETHADPAMRPTLTYSVVPEPSTYGLLGAGALGAVALVRRRRRTKAA